MISIQPIAGAALALVVGGLLPSTLGCAAPGGPTVAGFEVPRGGSSGIPAAGEPLAWWADDGRDEAIFPGLAPVGPGVPSDAVSPAAPPCGGRGEPACTIDQQLLRLRPACDDGLDELYLPLGSCFPREDLRSPSRDRWPVEESAPGRRSVFLIHGMTGGLSSFSPSANALAAALRERGHRVFNLDYNADGDTPRGLELHELRSQRWRRLGSYGKPLSGTTLSLSDVGENLREAILRTPTRGDITLIGHSMGGLVARSLVQRHYAALRRAGKRIAEVITLGTPHTGGGFGLPEIRTARGAQTLAMCWGLRALRDPTLRRVSYQACQMDRWHGQRERLPAGQFIDNRDFPQIHWVSIAGSGQPILHRSLHAAYAQIQDWLNAHLGLGLKASIAELDSDSLVAVTSAFGLAVDTCFPHRREEPAASLTSLVPDSPAGGAKLRRIIRLVGGQPLYSAACFLPPPTGRRGERPAPMADLGRTNHRYDDRPEVIAFVVTTLQRRAVASGIDQR